MRELAVLVTALQSAPASVLEKVGALASSFRKELEEVAGLEILNIIVASHAEQIGGRKTRVEHKAIGFAEKMRTVFTEGNNTLPMSSRPAIDILSGHVQSYRRHPLRKLASVGTLTLKRIVEKDFPILIDGTRPSARAVQGQFRSLFKILSVVDTSEDERNTIYQYLTDRFGAPKINDLLSAWK